MGPDRFDDVEFTMLEQPEPPRRPRLRRWTLAPLATVLAAGVLAAGASALAGDEPAPAPAPKGDAAVPQKPDYRNFRGCEKGERHGKRNRSSSSSELRH